MYTYPAFKRMQYETTFEFLRSSVVGLALHVVQLQLWSARLIRNYNLWLRISRGFPILGYAIQYKLWTSLLIQRLLAVEIV